MFARSTTSLGGSSCPGSGVCRRTQPLTLALSSHSPFSHALPSSLQLLRLRIINFFWFLPYAIKESADPKLRKSEKRCAVPYHSPPPSVLPRALLKVVCCAAHCPPHLLFLARRSDCHLRTRWRSVDHHNGGVGVAVPGTLPAPSPLGTATHVASRSCRLSLTLALSS